MTQLSDKDWDRLSAYHDGEMSSEDARKFRKRLTGEAELASTLERFGQASHSLSALRPVPIDEVQSRMVSSIASRLGWLTGGALAASVIIAVAMSALKSDQTMLLDIHGAYLSETFTVTSSDLRAASTISTAETPDLTGGNLKAVAFSSFDAGTVAHYSGQNGCRLSYFRGRDALSLPTGAGSQISAWSTGDGFHHAIIATGMDMQKFNAISAFLQQETQRKALNKVYAAMLDATENATRCVG
jgi:hypothetical protein